MPNDPTAEVDDATIMRLAFKRKLRQKKKKERDAEEEAVTSELNITAMMDMMTILLVFLLKSFGTNSANITLNEELQLPNSSATLKMDELVAVTVTRHQILVGDKKVVDLEEAPGADGRPVSRVPAAQLSGMLIVPVEASLRDELEKLEKIARYNPNYQFKPQISVIGDAEMPYDVLTRVLYTAGKVGIDGYKFVVIGKQSG